MRRCATVACPLARICARAVIKKDVSVKYLFMYIFNTRHNTYINPKNFIFALGVRYPN